MGCLLMLPAPALPLLCAVNVLAALVLLPVSLARVVVGANVVWAIPAPEAISIAPTRRKSLVSARTFPPRLFVFAICATEWLHERSRWRTLARRRGRQSCRSLGVKGVSR